MRFVLRGAVQGVGFRPFVYRLATGLGLGGWVSNSSAGLVTEVEGAPNGVAEFAVRLFEEKPAPAVILTSESVHLAPEGSVEFVIQPSTETDEISAAVLPDLAVCAACLSEMRDPADRRYRYPFINCTLCGPRYTIVTDVPYDRPRTTMRAFPLCPACEKEYRDPADRRFHAQPVACPACGPSLSGPVAEAAAVLAGGGILAMKGIGGYHLFCDARNEEAVAELRRRKRREERPFALMMRNAGDVRHCCRMSDREAALLCSSAAPIVLLDRLPDANLAPSVAPGSPYLGVMLPYSPLHHLLLDAFPHPVVATSGNLSDEPIATAVPEAHDRLGGLAHAFLDHDRPIARPCDDSLERLSRGRPMLLRRARGYAPLPVYVSEDLPKVLAVGAHLKNTIAIALGRQVIVSQHVGDLETPEARQAFERAIEDLLRLYRFEPDLIACDLHPDYYSTRWARAQGLPVVSIQHHEAHVAACAAENGVREPYLGVAWDGTGFGHDGAIWGGEMFFATGGRMERFQWLRPFVLPGGEAAVKEGWRVAASLLHECGLPALDNTPPAILHMIERRIHCPVASSMGRLFDAVAALTGVARRNGFEGQAAMLLEERAQREAPDDDAYPLPNGDWRPLIRALVADPARAALRFHNALANWIVDAAAAASVTQVVLSGGTFQNRYLTERTASLLEARDVRVFTHQRVPPNDGGISLGQAVLCARHWKP